jgi:hypothetical protein
VDQREKAIDIAGVVCLALLFSGAYAWQRHCERVDIERVIDTYEIVTTEWKLGISDPGLRGWLRAARIAREDLEQTRGITLVHLRAADSALGAADSACRMKMSGATSFLYKRPSPLVSEEMWWPRGVEVTAKEDAEAITLVGTFIERDEDLKRFRQRGDKEIDISDIIQRAMSVTRTAVAKERRRLGERDRLLPSGQGGVPWLGWERRWFAPGTALHGAGGRGGWRRSCIQCGRCTSETYRRSDIGGRVDAHSPGQLLRRRASGAPSGQHSRAGCYPGHPTSL